MGKLRWTHPREYETEGDTFSCEGRRHSWTTRNPGPKLCTDCSARRYVTV